MVRGPQPTLEVRGLRPEPDRLRHDDAPARQDEVDPGPQAVVRVVQRLAGAARETVAAPGIRLQPPVLEAGRQETLVGRAARARVEVADHDHGPVRRRRALEQLLDLAELHGAGGLGAGDLEVRADEAQYRAVEAGVEGHP